MVLNNAIALAKVAEAFHNKYRLRSALRLRWRSFQLRERGKEIVKHLSYSIWLFY